MQYTYTHTHTYLYVSAYTGLNLHTSYSKAMGIFFKNPTTVRIRHMGECFKGQQDSKALMKLKKNNTNSKKLLQHDTLALKLPLIHRHRRIKKAILLSYFYTL